jgi:hypothetical protein
MSETPFHRSDRRDEGVGATVRAHWMSVPVLEAALGEMNKQPIGLDVLRAAVASIVETLNRRVTIEIYEKVVTFSYPGLIFHNVSVRDDEYHVLFQHEAAQATRIYGYTDELAWRVCNYPCSPAEMREARSRAESQGITHKKLPASFFRPRRRTSDANDPSHQS